MTVFTTKSSDLTLSCPLYPSMVFSNQLAGTGVWLLSKRRSDFYFMNQLSISMGKKKFSLEALSHILPVLDEIEKSMLNGGSYKEDCLHLVGNSTRKYGYENIMLCMIR